MPAERDVPPCWKFRWTGLLPLIEPVGAPAAPAAAATAADVRLKVGTSIAGAAKSVVMFRFAEDNSLSLNKVASAAVKSARLAADGTVAAPPPKTKSGPAGLGTTPTKSVSGVVVGPGLIGNG